jgi:hypothetical protein
MRDRGNRRPRLFLLSPADCNGVRARRVMADEAAFPLAERLRSPQGAPLGEVFSFVSGLYFRGKLAYARRFAAPAAPAGASGILVITPNAGLRAADVPVTRAMLRAFAEDPIDLDNARYRRPLEQTAEALDRRAGSGCDVVLLGSVASGKYVDVLLPIFGRRLLFPPAFVGRGDMSRGGLLLRSAASGVELDYAPVAGRRPPGPSSAEAHPARPQRTAGPLTRGAPRRVPASPAHLRTPHLRAPTPRRAPHHCPDKTTMGQYGRGDQDQDDRARGHG